MYQWTTSLPRQNHAHPVTLRRMHGRTPFQLKSDISANASCTSAEAVLVMGSWSDATVESEVLELLRERCEKILGLEVGLDGGDAELESSAELCRVDAGEFVVSVVNDSKNRTPSFSSMNLSIEVFSQ